ncbi:MAG: LLM class F420-dependent oxidoreductase [Candidatus Thorarchaeota archaeon]|jgi:probable F420-dependent oxidoreductase
MTEDLKLGVVVRPINMNHDSVIINDFVKTIEDLGFDFLLAYDIVTKTEYSPPPTSEPFVLISYLAGLTKKLDFATGVVILPSRQTVLTAKQAAEVDFFTGGRLRLGVAVGWNEKEYLAMDSDFNTRGKRIEEQIAVMRELWTKPIVSFKGEYHNLNEIGIDPLPVQRPIPIWLGGYADVVLHRIARIGDGWLAHITEPESAEPMIEKLHSYLDEAGRKQADVGIDVCLDMHFTHDWGDYMQAWSELGATHFNIDTTRAGLKTPQEHIDMICEFKDKWG